MKKGRSIMLLVCALACTLVIGIFIGRNFNQKYTRLPNNQSPDPMVQTEIQPQDYRIDINEASKAQLMELPGIGETLADRIIVYRTQNGKYSGTDELMNIDGIGEKTLQQIENLIKVGG